MTLRSLYFSALCLMVVGVGFTACSEDDDQVVFPTIDPVDSTAVAYILHEGNMGDNNASLGRLVLSNQVYQGNWYLAQNGEKLGDLAYDMKAYDGSLYIVVGGSKYIVKIDREGRKFYQFTSEQGEPRSMVIADGKIYVASYSGQVHCLDAASLAYEQSVQVAEKGIRLEGIAERDGKLYVAVAYKVIPATEPGAWDTYVYQKEVAVVDANTMTKDTVLTVGSNPSVMATLDSDVYLYSIGDYYMEGPVIQRIRSDYSVDTVAVANKMAVVGDKLFLVNAEVTYDPVTWVATTVNTFMAYDPTTEALEGSFIGREAPAELASATIYLLAGDPVTGEIYIGTTDYVNTGTIYRFSADGQYVGQFDSEGLNPSKMVFVN